MKTRWFGRTLAGENGSAQGGRMKGVNVVLFSIFLILLAMVTLTDFVMSQKKSQVNLDKEIPFMCTHCDYICTYKIRDLQKMQQVPFNLPTTQPTTQMAILPMGPLELDCPKCHEKTLTQAVECPNCKQIFVMKMDPTKNLFDDKCPKCHESYSKSWQEHYRKETGNE